MNCWGDKFKIIIGGGSHAPFVGIVIEGVPAGTALSVDDFSQDLARRQGGVFGTTPRREADVPELLSGVANGRTTGDPIEIRFENRDIRPADYPAPLHFRPSHADRTACYKYGITQTGGGQFSGRMTVALVAAGVVAKKLLPDVAFTTRILSVGGHRDRFEEVIAGAAADRDSVGGVIECRATGVQTGLGEPFFDSAESLISHLLFSIPGIKGVEFGDGFAVAARRGSENNDPIIDAQGRTSTNHDGGINGGITNGNDVVVRVAVKPTPSIGRPQQTFNAATGRIEELVIQGRHDVCIALRAAVVVEAAVAIALANMLLR